VAGTLGPVAAIACDVLIAGVAEQGTDYAARP
jgi:hypothetical protein